MTLQELTLRWIEDFNSAAAARGAPLLDESYILDDGVIGIGNQLLVIIEEDLQSGCGYHVVMCPNKNGDVIQVSTALSLSYESPNAIPKELGLAFWMEGDTMHWVGEDDELSEEQCKDCEHCTCQEPAEEHQPVTH